MDDGDTSTDDVHQDSARRRSRVCIERVNDSIWTSLSERVLVEYRHGIDWVHTSIPIFSHPVRADH